ncbi:FecR family protein [Arcticibacter tournemirensis]
MEENRLKELIDKYLKGTASEDERQKLENWYQSFDSKPGLTDFLTEEQNRLIQNKLLDSINQRIDSELYKMEDYESGDRKVKNINYKTWFVAASVTILIAFLWYRNTVDETVKVKEVEWVKIDAEKSQVKKVTLPDGSMIWVNAESSVRFKKNFEGKMREVWLEGEAYFDVVHDTSKAFEVHAGTLTTHVLGTAFNVNAYDSDRKAVVTVTRGKVAVASEKASLAVLERNQQIIYNRGTERFAISQSSSDDLMSWTKGRLIFKDETFAEIVKRLERWYGVEIGFRGAGIGECKLTASFDTSLPVNDVLKMLCKVSGNKKVHLSKKNTYLIAGKSCS